MAKLHELTRERRRSREPEYVDRLIEGLFPTTIWRVVCLCPILFFKQTESPMPPQEEEVRAEMNKVDQGGPIPTIEVALAKRLWKAVGPLPPNVANAVGTDTLTAQQ